MRLGNRFCFGEGDQDGFTEYLPIQEGDEADEDRADVGGGGRQGVNAG